MSNRAYIPNGAYIKKGATVPRWRRGGGRAKGQTRHPQIERRQKMGKCQTLIVDELSCIWLHHPAQFFMAVFVAMTVLRQIPVFAKLWGSKKIIYTYVKKPFPHIFLQFLLGPKTCFIEVQGCEQRYPSPPLPLPPDTSGASRLRALEDGHFFFRNVIWYNIRSYDIILYHMAWYH